MRKSRILFRADGGNKLGFGHWSRCLFLLSCYQSLDAASDVILYTRNPTEFKEAFPEAKIKVIHLKEEEEFINALSRLDVVLLDGYEFTPEYFSMLNQKEAFLVYVDDLVKQGSKADIIINHSLGIKPEDYLSPALYTSFYLGSCFSMVPELFKRNSQNIDKTKRLNRLLVCMGGADPFNETARLIEKYHNHLQDFEQVYIVLGQQYPFEETFRKRWGGYCKFQIFKGLRKEEVSQLMQQCGVAMLPASTMAVEYAHIGGVLGVVQTADNQEKLFQGLLKEGVAVELQKIFRIKDKTALYTRLIGKQCQVFDGRSQERFIKLFNEIANQQRIKVRTAKMDDASLTFRWASDKKVRVFSFSKEEISWEGHQQWFSKKVEEESCVYLIAEIEDLPVGSVRFDIKNKKAVISYLVDSRWHGKGLGKIILAEGIKHLQKNKHNIDELVGFVLEENKASMRIFERMGFEKAVEESQLRYFKEVTHD